MKLLSNLFRLTHATVHLQTCPLGKFRKFPLSALGQMHFSNIMNMSSYNINGNLNKFEAYSCKKYPNQVNFMNMQFHKEFHISKSLGIMEDRNSKALTVWSNIRELKSSPLPALWLGLAGLVPFVGAPAYMVSTSLYLPQLAFAQVAYGATILSFVGGVRWGFTIPEENPIPPDWKNLGYSGLPSFVAWVGLLLPYPLSVFTLMGGLSAAAYFDMVMYGYPPWFKGLRFLLSSIAVLSLWTTFMCSYLLNHEGQNKDKNSKDIQVNN